MDEEDALGFIDRWTADVYFENFKETTDYRFILNGDPRPFNTVYETDTFSAYGQGTHKFNESTRITLGLRAESFPRQQSRL